MLQRRCFGAADGFDGFDPERKNSNPVGIPALVKALDRGAAASSAAGDRDRDGNDDGMVPVRLFRGIPHSHPCFEEVIRDRVVRPTGTQTFASVLDRMDAAADHNGSAEDGSPFTSWTRTAAVAARYAGETGAIVVADVSPPHLTWSPDAFAEGEVLVDGPVAALAVARLGGSEG